MARVVLTGASGFIGNYTADALRASGHTVLGLGRTTREDITATDYSITDLIRLTQGYDTLIHLAGSRLIPDTDMSLLSPFINPAIHMLDNLLGAAKVNSFKRIVTASSIGVYSPENTAPYSEYETPLPGNPYGLSKYITEQAAEAWARRNNVSVAHMRLAQCYGCGEKETPLLMRFIAQARRKETLNVTNGGTFFLDEIYVKDTADALCHLVDSPLSGAFNIGSNQGYSVVEIAKTVNYVFDNNDNVIVQPSLNTSSTELLRHMDTTRANTDLGWAPRYSLEEGLRDMHNILK